MGILLQAPGAFSVWFSAHAPTLALWVGAVCTLGLYTVLYRENKVYRLFEHIFLGLATGYMIAQTWTDMLYKKWWVPLWQQGQWWYILFLVAGLYFYFIYSRKHAWLARLAIGFFMGVGAGQQFQAFVNDTWPQVVKSFKPIVPHGAGVSLTGKPVAAVTWPNAINNLVFIVILLAVLSYFFFAFEQKTRLAQGSAKLGRWLMMFAFGAIFGSTVMARLALLIDRVDFLINETGPTLGGAGGSLLLNLLLIGLGISFIVVAIRSRGRDTTDGSMSETTS